jgi:hypothetical protein
MKKVLLAGILGGVIAFVWSSIVHMSPVGLILTSTSGSLLYRAVLVGLM